MSPPGELTEGDIEIVGLLPFASNYTYLGRLTGEEKETLVVYKPLRGETPLWDFPSGTLCKREVAAYMVSEALGWGYVPTTVLRDGPHGVGAVQRFVQHNPSTTALDVKASHADDLRRIALYDLIVNNADRKAGHILMDAHRRIWAVDHGICFHSEPKLRTVLWDYQGESIPREARADVERLAERVDGSLGVLLETLLRPNEITALYDRVNAVGLLETYPAPGPGRPVPWPPI